MSHYSVLELNSDCSLDELKAAYKRLVLKHHPDKAGENETFHVIDVAYKTLLDPVLRAAYDNELSNAAKLKYPVWQVVTLADLDFEEPMYHMDCRCGSQMKLHKDDTANMPLLLECDDCSTVVRVEKQAQD